MQTNLGNMFRLFSVAIKPPTSDLAVVIVSGELVQAVDATWRALGLGEDKLAAFNRALADLRAKDGETVLHELRREHTRLFFGNPPLIENTEGTWRKRAEGKRGYDLMVNSYSLEVQAFMRSCGAVEAAGRNDCIDYPEVECEFAAMLAEQPQSLLDLGKDPLDLLQRFMDEHMGKWVPGFCSEVSAAAHVPYYQALTDLLASFVGEFCRAD